MPMDDRDMMAGWAGMLGPAMDEKGTLRENRQAFVRKFGGEPGFEETFGAYWDAVRKRVKGPEKDVEYWQNRPWAEFRDFVAGFDLRNRRARRDADVVARARKAGARLLGAKGGFEAWYVPTFEAAQQIGCFYKGRSAQWCILNRDRRSWDEYVTKGGDSFVFVVRQAQDRTDTFNKAALEIGPDGKLEFVWGDDDDGHRPYDAAAGDYLDFGAASDDYDPDDPMSEIFADMDAADRAAAFREEAEAGELPDDVHAAVDFAMARFGNAPRRVDEFESRREAERRAARIGKAAERMGRNAEEQDAWSALAKIDGVDGLVPMRVGGIESRVFVWGGRAFVTASINGAKVPFYCSTGLAGKSSAAAKAGGWYAFFGIGPDGWLNKMALSEKIDMKYGWGSGVILRFQRTLDAEVGDIAGVLDGSVYDCVDPGHAA